MVDISVITAAYNSASVIERNVRSVGRQSLQPVEHIIIDDGSTDGTASIADALRAEFPHLRVIRQKNGGAARARNAGIAKASGRFIAFLDSDDEWTEQKLSAQIEFMLAEDVVFSYGDYDTVEASSGESLGRMVSPPQLAYSALLNGCPIGCLTVAFDQEALGKRYMPDVQRGQDWGLWLELARQGTTGRRYPGCHAVYHRSSASLSSAKIRKALDIYRIYRDQEKLGRVKSMYYLQRHMISAVAKTPARQGET